MGVGNKQLSDAQVIINYEYNPHEFGDKALLTEQMDVKVKVNKNPHNCVVRLLDGSDFSCYMPPNAKAESLVDQVCAHLNLEEKEYFSCAYINDKNVKFWVIHDKTLSSQMKKAKQWNFLFEVKFYPTEPEFMKDVVTRYQLVLQVRTDILTGKLPCSYVTHQLLGSYVVQSEFGDYDIDEHGDGIGYIKNLKFMPEQNEELLEKISILHRTNVGTMPNEAELQYLENAKILAFYGVDMHAAVVRSKQTVDGEVLIGVSSLGLTVYKERLTVYRWPWQKLLHFSYTRKGFKVTIRQKPPHEKQEKLQTIYKYSMPYDMAKRLWRAAVEHHAFFRLSRPIDPERAPFPRTGSKFRYSGKTQQQVKGEPDSDRPVPFINRGNNSRFITLGRSGTLDNSTAGYSTDRGEKYHIDVSRSNTLDLKDRKKRNVGSVSDLDSSVVPIAGFEDDRNLTAVDHIYENSEESRVALLSANRVSYNKPPYQPPYQGSPSYDQQDSSFYRDSSYQDYREGDFGRGTMNGSKFGTSYESPDRSSTIKQTTINVVMVANRNGGPDGDEMLPPYQENILRHQGTPAGGRSSWESNPGRVSTTSREGKTMSRTYTDTEGNVITEFTTERENIIERRVEKRTLITEVDEDFDHDQALLAAIQAVTNMDQDLSVAKIEIQTTAERV